MTPTSIAIRLGSGPFDYNKAKIPPAVVPAVLYELEEFGMDPHKVFQVRFIYS